MAESLAQLYTDFHDIIQHLDEDELFANLNSALHRSRNTFAVNRKLMQKAIDVSWVEAIENGLIHVDNVIRNPRRTIEDVEEVVPIALSKKITVESIKHLAQHTDYIQSVDPKTGKITPSKILNVYKEETLETYENKFVNTLVDRLYIFINSRYEKLVQITKDEQAFSLGYNTVIDDGKGGKMKIDVKLETVSDLESYDESGYSVWQRVEKLKSTIEGYKGSELCTTLGNSFIRPPVMRTNAIMKNVDLKACLALWQYIESYDKAGYEINMEDTAVEAEDDYIENFYRLALMQMVLFRYQVDEKNADEAFKTLKKKSYTGMKPKFVKKFDKELSPDYDITVDGVAGYIDEDGEKEFVRTMPADPARMFEEINKAITIEKAYREKLENERLMKLQAEEEARKRREERERIEREREERREALRRKKEEEQRRLEEMLAKKKAEQEAAERERQRQEEERLALLEEKRKKEEEERKRREEQERIEAERKRLEEEKSLVRSELGDAEGIDINVEVTDDQEEKMEMDEVLAQVTEEEIEEVKANMEEDDISEDPREVVARMKIEQQKLEKERIAAERAAKLKEMRNYYESKSFETIYREYTYNPIYLIPRLFTALMVLLFNRIPADTDNPDWKRKAASIAAAKEAKKRAKEEQKTMEKYYRKYATSAKYSFLRSIDDAKFKRMRKKQDKNRPKQPYVPPTRTPEEEKAIREQMKKYYREYHVSRVERIRRWWEEQTRKYGDGTDGETGNKAA
ncbi:DUF2357 domain-containing protein [Eubacterium xylanophilum]|uniref:DUF2357 domain-containing protein n=1 Tax=Eubacterium xylanophilum TaxID=39497 RepID=UPI000479CD5E|nr:DUF2357 domain-containing protein [Eubacterium xylanophilum]